MRDWRATPSPRQIKVAGDVPVRICVARFHDAVYVPHALH